MHTFYYVYIVYKYGRTDIKSDVVYIFKTKTVF